VLYRVAQRIADRKQSAVDYVHSITSHLHDSFFSGVLSNSGERDAALLPVQEEEGNKLRVHQQSRSLRFLHGNAPSYSSCFWNDSDSLTIRERPARRMGLSARHLTRVCSSEMRMSPRQFVDRLRVEPAQEMIDSSSMGLKAIADACGFKTPDAMRQTFLRVIGVSPTTYSSRFKRASHSSK
jgi:AraC-like DNA-binding protein